MFGRPTGYGGGLFDDLRRIEREMDQLYRASPWPRNIRAAARGSWPPVNIGHTPEQVDVYLFAAGLDTGTLDISIQQNLLTIAGERNLISEEGANYYRKERYDGDFRRVVTLPEDVDPDQVDASYREGVLHIAIKRRASTRPRQIEIK